MAKTGQNTIPQEHQLLIDKHKSEMKQTLGEYLNIDSENELFKKYPEFEPVSRAGIEEQLENYQEMLVTFMSSTPVQRYQNVLKNRPDLLQRVPQYQLASYLGITPESLSRIRKRLSTKEKE